MKKILPIILCIIFAVTGCQKTPDKEAVISKDSGEFEEAVKEDLPEEFTQQSYIDSLPHRWTDSYEKYDGRLKMDIDAEIVVSDKINYPIATIEPYFITVEQANKIIVALFGTLDVNSADLPRTKSQIQDMIVEVKAEYQQAINDNDEEKAEYLQKVIDSLTEMLKDAPEKAEPKKYSGEFTVYEEERSTQHHINIRENPTDRNSHILQIVNIYNSPYGNGYNSSATYANVLKEEDYYFYDDGSIDKMSYDENPLFNTEEALAAIETANKFIEDIGLEGRVIDSIIPYCKEDAPDKVMRYKIRYTRKFNDITIPAFVQLGGAVTGNVLSDGDYYKAPYMQESLEVDIENNKVDSFNWDNIYSVKEIAKDDIRLLPFDEIMANAESQLSARYTQLESENNGKMYVDKIILTYAVESVKDAEYEYMLIPVWAFYGGSDYGDGCEMSNGTVLTGRHERMYSLLTINAVDGSIIQ